MFVIPWFTAAILSFPDFSFLKNPGHTGHQVSTLPSEWCARYKLFR